MTLPMEERKGSRFERCEYPYVYRIGTLALTLNEDCILYVILSQTNNILAANSAKIKACIFRESLRCLYQPGRCMQLQQ